MERFQKSLFLRKTANKQYYWKGKILSKIISPNQNLWQLY